ncbi:MAG: tRNA glutamyl-Q(34) synthetase GluQRS [Bacteroidaceae bacterium]|nr:tRNA glutamyl-Q(34) synthetase GluQRS [Bacteroidaceae bacterium]
MTRGRFAPSPTGRMHLGNVFCALLSWLSAKSKGGEWVLRIEDLDPQRSKKDYALQLMDDLQWLDLPWDGEPVWQSQRGEIYEEYLQRLTDMGLTYPCYCTRADIMATQAPHETDGRVVYKGTCRPNPPSPSTAQTVPLRQGDERSGGGGLQPAHSSQLTVNRPPLTATTRLIVPDCTIPFTDGHYGKHDINLAKHCGDYIIRRKDGAWAYQLAVVVDDALMGVTEIARGRDLLLSSPQQIHLRNLLFQSTENRVQSTEYRVQMTDDLLKQITDSLNATSLPHQTVPLRQGDERSGGGGLNAHHSPLTVDFFHHPLLCNAEGQRLCKRDKSMDLGYLRGTGITPQEIIGKLAYLAGLTDTTTPITPSELLPLFSWKKIPTEDIILK